MTEPFVVVGQSLDKYLFTVFRIVFFSPLIYDLMSLTMLKEVVGTPIHGSEQ